MKSIELVHHRHVEGRCSRAFFLVTAHVKVCVIPPTIHEPVNQPWIAVKGEHGWLVFVKIVSKASSLSPCGCSRCG